MLRRPFPSPVGKDIPQTPLSHPWDSIYDDNGHSKAYLGVERFLVRVGPIPTKGSARRQSREAILPHLRENRESATGEVIDSILGACQSDHCQLKLEIRENVLHARYLLYKLIAQLKLEALRRISRDFTRFQRRVKETRVKKEFIETSMGMGMAAG